MADLVKDKEMFRWPVSVSRRIEAPPQQIWTTIASPANLEICHPFCEKNPVHEWPGVGSRDTIHYYSGMVLDREFVNWIDGLGYDLLIAREGGDQSLVSWRITETGNSCGTLRITIYPSLLQKIPLFVRWIPHRLRVQPYLRVYLESVLKGFEWSVTTGKPVQKNQFGFHPWFSVA